VIDDSIIDYFMSLVKNLLFQYHDEMIQSFHSKERVLFDSISFIVDPYHYDLILKNKIFNNRDFIFNYLKSQKIDLSKNQFDILLKMGHERLLLEKNEMMNVLKYDLFMRYHDELLKEGSVIESDIERCPKCKGEEIHVLFNAIFCKTCGTLSNETIKRITSKNIESELILSDEEVTDVLKVLNDTRKELKIRKGKKSVIPKKDLHEIFKNTNDQS